MKKLRKERSNHYDKKEKVRDDECTTRCLAKWHKYVSEQDTQALAEALADDVLFRSPVIWKPKEGKATAMLYFSSAARVLEDFSPRDAQRDVAQQ